MEQDNPFVLIKKIKFKDGTEIEFKKDDIVIFVGANNVGKSRTLKDIKENLIGTSIDNIIINEIEYTEENFNEKSMRNYFERNFAKDVYSNYNIQIGYNNSYSFNDYNFEEIQTNPKIFYKILFTILSTENRLNLTSPIFLNDIRDRFKLNIMEKLEYNEDNIKKLNKFLINSFKKGEINSTINSKRRDAHENLKKMEFLHEQGDGIRSAVAILAALIVNEHS